MKTISWPLRAVMVFCAVVALLLVVAVYNNRPERLLRKAELAEKAAQAAQERGDVENAGFAAEDAREAALQLQKRVEADKSKRPEWRHLLSRAQAAARSAGEFAALAGEEHELRVMLDSLRVGAYRKTRGVIISTVLPRMAAAAESAAAHPTGELSSLERSLAEQAWRVAGLVSGRPPLPDGQPDWTGVAADLRNWNTNLPMEFRAFLGLGSVLAGRSDFALVEFEGVDAGCLRGTNAIRLYHGGRALLFALHGWNRLAVRESEEFCRRAEIAEGPLNARQFLVLLHSLLAYDALKQREFERMDAEITLGLRAWPGNPLLVYLTGEKLAANGEWEKAATSLEAQAAGSADAWVANLLAQRARDLRDGKGSAKSLVLDGQLLTDFAVHYTANAAKNSAAGRKLGEAVDGARTFGRNLWQQAISLGDPTPKPDATNR